MPQVEIEVGGRTFEVACQEGEEAHLRSAAALLDAEAQAISGAIGRLPESQMLLMAGLMLADKATGLEEQVRALEADLAQARAAAARQPATVEVEREVRVEVPTIPHEVRQLFAEMAEETEALAQAVAALVPEGRLSA